MLDIKGGESKKPKFVFRNLRMTPKDLTIISWSFTMKKGAYHLIPQSFKFTSSFLLFGNNLCILERLWNNIQKIIIFNIAENFGTINSDWLVPAGPDRAKIETWADCNICSKLHSPPLHSTLCFRVQITLFYYNISLIIYRQSPIFSSVTKTPFLANFMQILIFSILLRQK